MEDDEGSIKREGWEEVVVERKKGWGGGRCYGAECSSAGAGRGGDRIGAIAGWFSRDADGRAALGGRVLVAERRRGSAGRR